LQVIAGNHPASDAGEDGCRDGAERRVPLRDRTTVSRFVTVTNSATS